MGFPFDLILKDIELRCFKFMEFYQNYGELAITDPIYKHTQEAKVLYKLGKNRKQLNSINFFHKQISKLQQYNPDFPFLLSFLNANSLKNSPLLKPSYICDEGATQVRSSEK